MYGYIVALTIFFVGCNLITLEVKQSTTVDVGDGTKDTYVHKDKKTSTESIEAEVIK